MQELDDQRIIKRVLALTEENNKILRKMRRSQRWSRIFSILYWLVVLGLSIGAYYLIQPYIDQTKELFGALDEIGGGSGTSTSTGGIPGIGNILDLFKGGK